MQSRGDIDGVSILGILVRRSDPSDLIVARGNDIVELFNLAGIDTWPRKENGRRYSQKEVEEGDFRSDDMVDELCTTDKKIKDLTDWGPLSPYDESFRFVSATHILVINLSRM